MSGKTIYRILADTLTGLRLILAAALAALGARNGQQSLATAVVLILTGWTADTLDGHLARKSGREGETFLGRNDLLVDVVFSLGGFTYFALSGFVSLWLALFYVAVSGGIVLRFPCRSAVITLMAPLAILPAAVSFLHSPRLLGLMALWSAITLVADRRQFARRVARYLTGFTATTERQ